jgi:hypothetical protein
VDGARKDCVHHADASAVGRFMERREALRVGDRRRCAQSDQNAGCGNPVVHRRMRKRRELDAASLDQIGVGGVKQLQDGASTAARRSPMHRGSPADGGMQNIRLVLEQAANGIGCAILAWITSAWPSARSCLAGAAAAAAPPVTPFAIRFAALNRMGAMAEIRSQAAARFREAIGMN